MVGGGRGKGRGKGKKRGHGGGGKGGGSGGRGGGAEAERSGGGGGEGVGGFENQGSCTACFVTGHGCGEFCTFRPLLFPRTDKSISDYVMLQNHVGRRTLEDRLLQLHPDQRAELLDAEIEAARAASIVEPLESALCSRYQELQEEVAELRQRLELLNQELQDHPLLHPPPPLQNPPAP